MDSCKRRRRLLSLTTAGDGAAAGPPPPPGKRLRAGCSAAAADPPQSPRWRLLSQSVLVVLFLRRSCRKDAAADGVTQIGSVVGDGLCRYLGLMFSKLENRLESMGQQIEDLKHKMEQITPFRPSQCNCNHQHSMHEADKEGVNAEALEANEGEAKSTSVRLRFLNEMKPPVYHDDELKAENNEAIRIGIFDGEQMIKSGPFSKVKLEILTLEGNFPYNSMDSWTSKEFNEHIACGRDGRGNVLASKYTVRLINGEASLGAIKFREGSCRARSGMFILAARVCNGGAKTGVKVQEAVMMPVVVQDRRNKSNGKSHPPKLDDKVHRLEEISINGNYCKRLAEMGIETVEDFLKSLNKDPDNLANILHIKKGSKAWEKMVTHARQCSLKGKHELKSYPDARTNVVLLFDCVHSLVGAWFDDSYIASDRLSSAQQVTVDKLKGEAYQLLDKIPFDHIMEGGFPIPNPMNANAGGHHAVLFKVLKQLKAWTMLSLSHHLQIQTMSITTKKPHRSSTRQAGLEQFSAAVAGWCQDSIAQPSSSHQSNHVFYPRAEDELALRFSEVNYSYQNNCGTPYHLPFQGASMASGFELVGFQRDMLEASTSNHNNLPFPPQQQPTFIGDPGSSAQVNMQSQGKAAILPSNWPSEPSTSTQGNLPPPQQWPQTQYYGNN